MRNKGIQFAVWAGLIAAAAPAGAQSVNSVRVVTSPPGLQFTIDGQLFVGATDFLWAANSKHTITAPDQLSDNFRTRSLYQGWLTNLFPGAKPNPSNPITADPNVKVLTLVFETDYLLSLKLFDCSAYPGIACPSAGRVEFFDPGNAALQNPVRCGIITDRDCGEWYQAGAQVRLEAYPNTGYVFTGWAPVTGQPQPVSTASYQIYITMNGPQNMQPMFAVARPISVTLATQPPNLQVLVDRTPYTTTANLEWGWDTTHSVGTIPTQSFLGQPYVFDSWSDGGDINHDFKMTPGVSAVTLTAKFVPAATVSFVTSPPGLALSIDGRQNWQSYNFVWAAGSSHAISAPATQVDAKGNKYQFVSWSNGKTAAFSYVMPTPAADDTLTARYQAIGQISLLSTPPGLALQMDTDTCTTPCSIERPLGATVKVSAAKSIDAGLGSRLLFQGWGDSGDAARVLTVTQTPGSYTANYRRQNQLSVSATPPEGASFTLNPSSPDGFYDAGSLVVISANLALGFRFAGWTGDYSGSSAAATVTLDAAKNAVLLLDRVPAIAPVGVRNAAINASAASVAPGSLISIFGANLAPAVQVSPTNPLAQTLASVTVRIDDTFLPLIFVSPGQINAQISAAMPEGAHRLIVRWEGKPETSAQIVVARNAPGLFATGSADQPVGSFLRANGDAVSADNPARAGEILTVLGTGLGPYTSLPPDGFLVDESAGYTLVDAVAVAAGDNSLDALYAGRSGVAVGIDVVRFRLPDTLPAANVLPVKLRINGQESNTVLLPISQ
jgi:uncharacterized protein (TIGR03437 family)